MIFPIAKSLQLLPRSRAGSVPPGRIGRLFSALLTLNERGSVLCPLLNCDHMRPTCDFIRIAIISTNILLGRFLLSVGLKRNDGKFQCIHTHRLLVPWAKWNDCFAVSVHFCGDGVSSSRNVFAVTSCISKDVLISVQASSKQLVSTLLQRLRPPRS